MSNNFRLITICFRQHPCESIAAFGSLARVAWIRIRSESNLQFSHDRTTCQLIQRILIIPDVRLGASKKTIYRNVFAVSAATRSSLATFPGISFLLSGYSRPNPLFDFNGNRIILMLMIAFKCRHFTVIRLDSINLIITERAHYNELQLHRRRPSFSSFVNFRAPRFVLCVDLLFRSPISPYVSACNLCARRCCTSESAAETALIEIDIAFNL